MTLKSLTSSRKVIDIINHYGHCISYNAIEELETEATYSSVSRTGICPEAVNKNENLSTGMAFDNFDRFVDTKNGKDTLHDTVGIIYQNIDPNFEEEFVVEEEEAGVTTHNKRRRRSFETIEYELPQCSKKLKKTTNIQAENEEEVNIIVHKSLYDRIDNVWMLSHAFRLVDTPMWTGFNSKIMIDDSPQQLISYLTPINESPTSNAVVLATMQQCMSVLQELSQEYMQVTYDLAIAKIALQIQATENNTFQKLFIHLGAFHIMMSYFKAIGKVINDCGLTTIMVESEMLASGSVSSFIEGKHFNRCKRLHPILSRSIREGDFQLFLDILPKITNLIFVFNHQNYTKWTVQYHYNLRKVSTTHPGLEDFQKGFFGIKRTNKPFSRQPIDLTLEQTINADAARTLTGIAHLTNSISARQRWARSHDIRSTIITHVLEEIGITKKQDISTELQPHNIKKKLSST
ncbi:uncharacterized protein TNCV_4844321 [Trichonephila clavipes]|uniref:Uncharacterized protein n=1 Tax=Trichonephila clavipes TaxID=2585209 RepID=A0A8X7BLX8_TRICX|nr:uncharacterized protein TNCV_4844321 [Trichonephila clavipes]